MLQSGFGDPLLPLRSQLHVDIQVQEERLLKHFGPLGWRIHLHFWHAWLTWLLCFLRGSRNQPVPKRSRFLDCFVHTSHAHTPTVGNRSTVSLEREREQRGREQRGREQRGREQRGREGGREGERERERWLHTPLYAVSKSLLPGPTTSCWSL